MELKKIALMSLLSLGIFAHAEESNQDKHPASYVEYLQSLSIAGQDVTISVPASFDLALQEINTNQQTLGFVPDGETINNWSEYVGVNISMHTDMDVRTRLQMVEEHLTRTYTNVKVSSTDFDNYISDDGRNFQSAKATFAYNDEQGSVVTTAICYSDFQTLIGTQVSIRAAKPSSRQVKLSQRLANSIISVSK